MEWKITKIAALLVALITIVVGMAGIVATDSAIALRRLYFTTPGRFYAAGAVRIAIGLVLILAASGSRWPRIMRAFGAPMCLQAIAANLFGIERARNHGMGDDAGNRAPTRWGRGGLGLRGFYSVCIYKEAVRSKHCASMNLIQRGLVLTS